MCCNNPTTYYMKSICFRKIIYRFNAFLMGNFIRSIYATRLGLHISWLVCTMLYKELFLIQKEIKIPEAFSFRQKFCIKLQMAVSELKAT